MDSKKNAKLRKMLNNPGIVVAPGVYDAVSARIAEKSGFETVYMTGNGTVASLLGIPDIGLATMSEMVMRGRQLSACLEVPLICDADTGYGNLNNVRRTVLEYEAAGVSAIHIEDQCTPKKCGAMEGLALVSAEEAAEKIRVALKARTDPNFTIIARTDAAKAISLDEAIRRLKMFADAGADVVFAEMIDTKEDILKITKAINNVPVMYDVLETTRERAFSIQELESYGVKVVICCLAPLFYTCTKLTEFYENYYESGTNLKYFEELMNLHDYEKLMGLEKEHAIRELLK